MREVVCGTIAPGMRVRRERFGLLFYNTRNAKLTFVRSRELLDVAPGPGNSWVLQAHAGMEEAKAKRLLQALQEKGLVVETLSAILQ